MGLDLDTAGAGAPGCATAGAPALLLVCLACAAPTEGRVVGRPGLLPTSDSGWKDDDPSTDGPRFQYSLHARLAHAAPGLGEADLVLRLDGTARYRTTVQELTSDQAAGVIDIWEGYQHTLSIAVRVAGEDLFHEYVWNGDRRTLALVRGPSGPEVLVLPDLTSPPAPGHHEVAVVHGVVDGVDAEVTVAGLGSNAPVAGAPVEGGEFGVYELPPAEVGAAPVLVDLAPADGSPELLVTGTFEADQTSWLLLADLPPWEGAPDAVLHWTDVPEQEDVLVPLQP